MLTTPIVEGAYYERSDNKVVGPARRDGSWWQIGGHSYDDYGSELFAEGGAGIALGLTRRVYIVSVDPAEVVAELRQMSAETTPGWGCERAALSDAADLVDEKLLGGKL